MFSWIMLDVLSDYLSLGPKGVVQDPQPSSGKCIWDMGGEGAGEAKTGGG